MPALRTTVVEPVGAGDAFAAGFLAGLLRGTTVTRALRLGHLTAVSALKVTGDHGPLPDAGRPNGSSHCPGRSGRPWPPGECRQPATASGSRSDDGHTYGRSSGSPAKTSP
ncbi:hypothetical protein SHKM778_52060 [Streptomyces sp. KM77-8]|uniref:Carbohydrate kinase PfkB domain-containing protein n=1 Tax=Streptomyces haneummycinicus TaxID=3074435 RepID=A0AAT9HMP9_9ACTN